MSCDMKGQPAVDAAEGSDRFQGSVDRAVAVDRQQLALRREAVVLIENPQRQVEQRYLELHVRLFPHRLNPYRSVFGRFEVRGGQSAHIAIADSRIA